MKRETMKEDKTVMSDMEAGSKEQLVIIFTIRTKMYEI